MQVLHEFQLLSNCGKFLKKKSGYYCKLLVTEVEQYF